MSTDAGMLSTDVPTPATNKLRNLHKIMTSQPARTCDDAVREVDGVDVGSERREEDSGRHQTCSNHATHARSHFVEEGHRENTCDVMIIRTVKMVTT